MLKYLVVIVGSLGVIGFWTMAQPMGNTEPDPQLIRLAVRATVHALPTQPPREIVVTEYVEVTRVVEVTRIVEVPREVTPAPEAPTPVPPAPTAEPVSQVAEPQAQAARAAEAPAPAEIAPEPIPPAVAAAPPPPAPPPVIEASTAPAPAITVGSCPAQSGRQYTMIPIEGGPTDRAAHEHGDLNPALRGSQPVDAHLGLVEINGPTDSDAPQIKGVFGDGRVPQFVGVRQYFDWNWGCGGQGCRGDLLGAPEATNARLQVTAGETLAPPRRNAEIYGGGFVVLVLFATENSITLGYTREDSVANGYAVHMEQICVDPNLLAAYRTGNNQGRWQLPALRNGEVLGVAAGDGMYLAVRDRGMFQDPRSRKDWWAGY